MNRMNSKDFSTSRYFSQLSKEELKKLTGTARRDRKAGTTKMLADIKDIRRSWDEGKISLRDVAEKYGISISTVRYWIKSKDV